MSPLVKGSGKKSISENISRLWHENEGRKKKRSKDQIVAIAYSVAGRSRKK
jgi:hypothetical protein